MCACETVGEASSAEPPAAAAAATAAATAVSHFGGTCIAYHGNGTAAASDPHSAIQRCKCDGSTPHAQLSHGHHHSDGSINNREAAGSPAIGSLAGSLHFSGSNGDDVIVIHVCDDNRRINRDFYCSREV